MASSRHLARRLCAFATGLSTAALGLPLHAQDQPAPHVFPNPLENIVRQNPKSEPAAPQPLMQRNPDGTLRPLPLQTRTTNTRPELAAKSLTQPEPFRGNQALGEQGVVKTQVAQLPFGSKGERVALAFRRGEFVPPVGERVQPALLQLAQQRAALKTRAVNGVQAQPSVYALLLINGRMDDNLKQTLATLGVELFGFYPHSAFQARIPAAVLQQVGNLPQVRWVGQPSRINKLAPELEAAVNGRPFDKRALVTKETTSPLFPVYIALFAPDRDNSVRSMIQDAGGTVNYYSAGISVVQADVTAETLDRILAMDAVLYTELVPVHTKFNTRSMPSINADWMWGAYDPLPPGSTGQVRVGVMDSGFYSAHTDFAHIVGNTWGISYISGESVWNDLDGHGTHVSGTILGRGAGDARYRGGAAGIFNTGNSNPDLTVAQVFNSSGTSVGTSVESGFDYMNGVAVANRVRQVFNFSGGAAGTNLVGTDTDSRKVDEIFANNVLPVIAAGNSGPGANSVASPGVAKGALTIGSIYDNDIASGSGLTPGNTDTIANTSGRGPTGDARVKPDVVAPGRYIDSVKAGTASDYTYNWSGTSMATPHVTALAAGLIGQYGMPAWATKAVIIASAINLGLPSSDQGRGKVDALLAHYYTDGGWSSNWNTIGSTGSLHYYDFTLSQTASQVRIALVWPDPPAAAGASVARVNDLDLGLQSGSLTTNWSANYYSATALDTVEFITVNNLPPGTYRIKVYSYNVASSQAYAICHKEIYGSTSPNLNLSHSTPYAVQPNTSFYAQGYASSGSYVASGVYGSFDPLSSGMTNQGLWYNRRSKPSSGTEWFYYPNPNDGTAGWYSPIGMNMGSIGAGYQRQIWWNVKAGPTEGVKSIRFSARSSNGGSGGITNNVIVDGTAPVSVALDAMHWGADLKPDIVWSTRDALSGLNVGSAYWRISTDGGTTWQAWNSTSSTGGNGTTATQTVTVNSVPFGQNSTNNLIQFYITDMAGNPIYTAPAVITTGIPTAISITPTLIPQTTNATGTVTLSATAPTDGAVVQLASSNPAVAAVPATTTVAAGATVSPTFTITTAAVAADTNVTISATYGGTTFNKVVTVKRNVSVSGTISLESVANSAQTMTFQFRPTDGSAIFNRSVVLSSTGTYTLPNIPARQYVVWVKGAKWLARTMNVNATAGNVTNANVSLPAGDCNNDNVDDINDLTVIIAAYNTLSGGSGYNAAADLNCDDKVDVSDLILLINHYNQAGTP